MHTAHRHPPDACSVGVLITRVDTASMRQVLFHKLRLLCSVTFVRKVSLIIDVVTYSILTISFTGLT